MDFLINKMNFLNHLSNNKIISILRVLFLNQKLIQITNRILKLITDIRILQAVAVKWEYKIKIS